MQKLTQNLKNIVNALNDGEHHNLEELAQKFALSPSTIKRIIKNLMDHGIEIKHIKNHGYILTNPLTLLDKNLIAKNLEQKNLIIATFAGIDSTNNYLKQFSGTKTYRACLAEHQTHGRGRLAHHWHSPFGQNIYLSLFYPFKKDINSLAGLSLVASLAVANTLRKFKFPHPLLVKWPNDIIYQEKKLAGILTELQAGNHGTYLHHTSRCEVVKQRHDTLRISKRDAAQTQPSRAAYIGVCEQRGKLGTKSQLERRRVYDVIIGIGINVNMLEDKSHQIKKNWTSIQKILGIYIDRNELCATLLNTLLNYIERFKTSGFRGFVNEWQQYDYLAGKNITLKTVNHKASGQVVGINDLGHLLIKLTSKKIQAFSSGEILNKK